MTVLNLLVRNRIRFLAVATQNCTFEHPFVTRCTVLLFNLWGKKSSLGSFACVLGHLPCVFSSEIARSWSSSYITNDSTKRFLDEDNGLEAIETIGRGERIRTSDPLVPNQVLYQAEPRPVMISFRLFRSTDFPASAR